MKYHIDKKTKDLFVTIGKENICIGKKIGKVMFEHNGDLFYICNSKYRYDGDFYTYKEGKLPICIIEDIRAKEPDYYLSIILLYKENKEKEKDGFHLGALYYYDFEKCKLNLVSKKSYSLYNVFSEDNKDFDILYRKQIKKWHYVFDLYLYSSYNKKSVKIINNLKDYVLFNDTKSKIRLLGFQPYDIEEEEWGSIIVYEDGNILLKIENCYNKYLIMRDLNNNYRILFAKYTAMTLNRYFNLVDIYLWENGDIHKLAENIISNSFSYYRDINDKFIFRGFEWKSFDNNNYQLDFYDANSIGRFIVFNEQNNEFFLFDDVIYESLNFYIFLKNGIGIDNLRNEISKGHNHNSGFLDIGNLIFYVSYLKFINSKIDSILYIHKNDLLINTYKDIDIEYEIDISTEKLFSNELIFNNILSIKDDILSFQRNNDLVFKEIVFYYSCSFGQYDNLIFEIGKRANKKELLENEFSDDDTLNYAFYFKKDSINDILLMDYALKKQVLPGLSIYNIEIIYLLKYCKGLNYEYTSALNKYRYHVLNLNHLNSSSYHVSFTHKNYEQHVKEMSRIIIGKLMEKYKYNNESELYYFLLDKYYKKEKESNNIIWRFIQKHNKDLEEIALEYNEIYGKLVTNNVIVEKWKSEADLFKVVYSIYPDSIIHYSPKWLGVQHYDIFIPSINVAFEYQGRQHYEPVNFFGGEEKFKNQLALDERKKNLSILNNIKLIEWRYDEPINKKLVEEKIKNVIKTNLQLEY